MVEIKYSLSFSGDSADKGIIDFYDAAEALSGFQRTLALTHHLLLNGEIIFQAPSLKGAQILISTPENGSWKVTATVLATVVAGIGYAGTAPKDTPLGHLSISLYDYVVKESLGFHVDFEKTLLQQYEEVQQKEIPIPLIKQSQMDALIEKCEEPIKQMHRPIYFSGTAERAVVSYTFREERKNSPEFNMETYTYVTTTNLDDVLSYFEGKVSSYNVNTFHGRLFSIEEQRTIPFDIHEAIRTPDKISMITGSLDANAKDRFNNEGKVRLTAFRISSINGRLKKILVTDVRRLFYLNDGTSFVID